MAIEVLDPTYGDDKSEFTRALRPQSLAGLTVGVISNGKQGTRAFFDALEKELRNQHGVADVVRVTKSNYSAPAEAGIMNGALAWNALIAGIGD
jgi:hypothetical protein